MIILQLCGLIIVIIMLNLGGLFIFAIVKEFFFSAYVPDKEKNPSYNEINWIEMLIISILILVVLYNRIESWGDFPNDNLLFPLAIVGQLLVIYKIYNLRKADQK